MNKFRTHNCSELNEKNVGQKVKLSGWLHRKRDHGNLLFIDLRDHFGITQCVIEHQDKNFKTLEKLRPESVILIDGSVIKRSKETQNKDLKTGQIEVKILNFKVLSSAKELPMPVFGEQDYPEEIRLKYRFIDLRRNEMHENIKLRSEVISFIRSKMIENNFLEFQTPILTASSPEGARDFLVPSRLHPGKFYALPQAPQQFKQMVMISGFDRYFQIAPCFRDEDGRADRSPGEHYQLDMEMSFVEQEDIFKIVEPIFSQLFSKFGKGKKINKFPFPRISYKTSLDKYGTDKPDLRNPIELCNVTNIFKSDDVKLKIFKELINKGAIVKGIPLKNTVSQPRSFFDNLNNWAISEGASGLAYITFEKNNGKIIGKGPIAKFFSEKGISELLKLCELDEKGSVFFVCNKEEEANKFAGIARQKIAEELSLIDNSLFNFCWIVDFPMFHYDEKEKKIDFSHNPFSMPQGGMNALTEKNPLDVLAWQFDIVCNGIELSSGAIRNHKPEIMTKAFEIAGYSLEELKRKFGFLFNAFKFGAPPHGGSAPGIDRIVMLLSDEENLREVVAFPMNQQAEDLMLKSPSNISDQHLKELGIKVKKDKFT